MSTVAFQTLKPLLDAVRNVPGPLAEFGVFRGDTLLQMLPFAATTQNTVLAVDSFRGMAGPGPRDGSHYPAGKFDVGGADGLRAAAADAGFADQIEVHEGYIPDVLSEIRHSVISFAHVDLDHYQPTLDVLRWLWPRLAPQGIVAVHDYFDDVDGLASGAVRDFAAETRLIGFEVLRSRDGVSAGVSAHAVFRKEAA